MTEKLFGRFHLKRPGFSLDAEIQVPSRGITGLFGDSGCGKTTLLRCLAGLERAEQGELHVAGKVWQDESKGIFLKPFERPIGLVFQEARLFPHMSVEDNLLYGVRRKRGIKGRPPEFPHILELLGIEPLLKRRPERLSGGELQRVAIGRALLTKPELLLMDEPLAALDNRRKREILPFLDRLHQELEIPIIYVSHSPEEMLHLADRMIYLEEGRTVGSGEVVEMLAQISVGYQVATNNSVTNQLTATVVAKDPVGQVITVDSAMGQLHFSGDGIEQGEQLRLRIAPSDIVLSSEPLRGVTTLNVVDGLVSEIREQQDHGVHVSLTVGQQRLCIVINQRCFAETPFVVGQRAYANFNKAFIERLLVPKR